MVEAIDDWHAGGVAPVLPDDVSRLDTGAPAPSAAGYAAVGRKR
ncbi:hypothetical protein [Nocardia nova]|nr:hypothetical protein [Nocardia nova]